MNYINKYKKYLILAIVFALVFSPFFMAKAENTIDILNIKTQDLGEKIVQVEWSTSEIAGGKIIFGEEKDYMPYYVIDGNAPARYHQVKIGNLKSKTTYYYQIIAYTGSQEVKSYVKTFKTGEYKEEIKPEIKNLKVAYVSGSAAVLTWESNEDSIAAVLYDSNKKYKNKTENKTYKKDQLIVLKNLKPNTVYYARAYSTDKSGNRSDYIFKQFTTLPTKALDDESLDFSYLRPSGPSDTQITLDRIKVSLKTNHYAKGKATLNKGKKILGTKNFDYGTEHSVEFIGLKPNAAYTIAISMTDIYGKKKNTTLNITTAKTFTDALIPQTGNSEEENIIVLGQEYSYYTPAAALYKAAGLPKVWSIVNNKKHSIASAESFLEYGYSWNKIKTVDKSVLARYQEVKLVKSPQKSDIYYLYENSRGEILKLKIPSPAVFNSYKNNSWGDIVKITQQDLDSYKDVRLVKTAGSQDVYYLDSGFKSFVSPEVFKKKGYSSGDVMMINSTHLASYKSNSDLK